MNVPACTLSFLNELNENGNKNKNVNESSPTLLHFCQIIEKIFYSKLQTTCNTLGFIKYNTPWSWLAEIAEDNHYLITFSYKNSVDGVKEQKHIVTNTGKFRLLIRHFLVNKCLHVPVQYLVNTQINYCYLQLFTSYYCSCVQKSIHSFIKIPQYWEMKFYYKYYYQFFYNSQTFISNWI